MRSLNPADDVTLSWLTFSLLWVSNSKMDIELSELVSIHFTERRHTRIVLKWMRLNKRSIELI